MLDRSRVLDLTESGALLCGRILGDLGADVIVVEKPSGHPSRSLGPYFHGEVDPEKSLFWYANCANKRGITLDIETADGRWVFNELIKGAEFFIESFSPGYLDQLGLGWETLSAINPRLVHVSITPFGQQGPYRDYKASDIVVMALSGFMSLCGDPDRPPVRISFPEALLVAGAEAAAGAMIAHHHRRKTGRGQRVDVSAQQAMTWNMMNAMSFWHANGIAMKRHGPNYSLPASGVQVRMVWPCQDGYVVMIPLSGSFGVGLIPRLVKWMGEEGVHDEFMEQKDWDHVHMSQEPAETYRRIEQAVGAFFRGKTTDEVIKNARARNLLIAPVNASGDLIHHPQLAARDFWQLVHHAELDEDLTYPGSYLAASTSEACIRRRAPLIGEHNREIYVDELGLSPSDFQLLRGLGVI